MQPTRNEQKGQEPDSAPKNLSASPAALESYTDRDYAKGNLLQIPTINLPKGGGALKSIDEKFQVNSANGTSSMSIAVPMSKSRSDFAPTVSLSYNSGNGNSPFGLGWNISLPSIKRRTDKRLPQYRDADNSDVFQLAGVEDLVVKMQADAHGDWKPDQFTTGKYRIKRFVPRIEGVFTLIEQVTGPTGMYWKTTTKDNVVMFFGITSAGRVADPIDPARIFEWLPEISYDDRGNCYQFFYVAEDLINVPPLVHEANRLNGNQQVVNTYLKQIAYGNTQPYSPTPSGGAYDPYYPVIPDGTGYLFNLVLDYGDHDYDTPRETPSTTWGCRLDAFSNGKPGFDMRSYRLCRRFLMFHQFQELDIHPVLVRSLDLAYRYYDFRPTTDPYSLGMVEADFIVSVTETGWIGNSTTGYQQAGYPSLVFSYLLPVWNTAVETIDAEYRMNIPEGLSTTYQFTDLYNEGIAGILSEQGSGWYYNSNLGEGVFSPASLIAPKPSFTGLDNGSLQLQSLTGDGRKFIVSNKSPHNGYFELTDSTQEWLPFMAFERNPAVNFNDPNIKLIDLNGDGMPDIVLSEEEAFTWYPAAGIRGYDSPELAPKPFDEEKGPAIVFADPVQCIFLSDMTGDGLTDIVRIRNGEISYWPNLGYGVFGAKVNMLNAPEFDRIDTFNPGYIHLADINGTGATDILYLGQDKLRAWLNLSGNAWGNPFEAPAFPHTASPNQLSVCDFLGNGTSCIVWSSPLAGNADQPIQYIDLMGGSKPYLLSGYTNGMGKTIALTYRSSTFYYLQDKSAGTPWITKLCFPVQCVAAIGITESVSGTSYSTSYTYHHGYYDHHEKEFRGFGRVDQIDTDIFDTNAAADQVPLMTRTWYHTGAYFGLGRILHQLASEYFQNRSFAEYNLPEPQLPANMTAEEVREAVRACKGMTIRQEVYGLDASTNPTLAPKPYTVAEHNSVISLLQPRGTDEYAYAVFIPAESESITYNYERNPADPRIAHTLNTAYNAYGEIVDSFSVVYARQPVDPARPGGVSLPGNQLLPTVVMATQQNTYITYTHYNYTQSIQTTKTYRLPVACETITSQVTGLSPSDAYFSLTDLLHLPGTLTKLKHERILFLQDDLSTPLPLTNMDTLGLVYQRNHLAFNAEVIALNGKMTTAMLQGARYIGSDTYRNAGLFPATDPSGEWWVPSGSVVYLNAGAPLPFLLAYQYLDAYGYTTAVAYDSHWLLVTSVTDPVNNTMTGAPVDYRTLLPQTVTDANGNAIDCRYDCLGHLVGVALRGKGEGDIFDPSFTSNLTSAQVTGFFSDPFTNGPPLLQGATTRYFYNFVSGGPFTSGTVTRQIHANQSPDPRVDTTSDPYQYKFEYTDGLGRIAMQKVQADVNTGAATAAGCDGGAPPRHQWIGKGKTVYNNKGMPVMQYEPYFSATPAYEEAPASGVSSILHYDAIGRTIRTDYPDGSFSQSLFDGWVQILYDQNDTVLDSAWYQRYSGSADPGDVDAADKAAAHYNTPTAAHLDPLGRNFYSVAYNMTSGTPAFYPTLVVLDLNNNPLSLIDAMGNAVMQWDYDLLSRRIHQLSMDAGERWMFPDVVNNPITKWDRNGPDNFIYSFTYDSIHRKLLSNVQINGISYLTSYNIYGENITINGVPDITNNLRGMLYRQFDDSGLITHYLYDFKGNLLQSSRIFAVVYKASNPVIPVIAWAGNAGDMTQLSTEEYVSLSQYDVLNRPILQTRPFLPITGQTIIPLPYNQTAVNNADVFIPDYGESGALTSMGLYYGGGTVATPYVTRICHNEKGQRLCIQYGNNTVTRYSYDPDTYRLTRLLTTGNKGAVILQDVNYYYDPAGNITYLIDNAQPPIWYSGQKVLSDGDYTYDAIYRLITAKGREQVAQNTVDESAANTNFRNYPFDIAPMPAPTDPLAMRSYTENYLYDAVGNMRQLQHAAGTGSYTRQFAYNNNLVDRSAFGVPSSTAMNNQLLATTIGGRPAVRYQYDGHGNMIDLPQLPAMAWNYKDQFVAATQQAVSSGTGQTTYYSYDAEGARTRKVTLGPATAMGTALLLSERLYIGNFEIYRTYDGGGNVTLQRETLHVMDDRTRIAMIDNKTIDTVGSDTTSLNTYYPRFQYGSDIESTVYELDGSGNVISYEEYHPFGTTSYQAADATLDVPARRYRFTGKERDEESGLYYHGARYYAPWLCRWTAADPSGVKDGINIYCYVSSNPIKNMDRTGMQHLEQGAPDDPVVMGCAGGQCYMNIRQSKLDSLQRQAAFEQQMETGSAIASNPLSGLFYLISTLFTDDPNKQHAAAMLGEATFGVAAGAAGVVQGRQQMQNVSSAKPPGPEAAEVRAAEEKVPEKPLEGSPPSAPAKPAAPAPPPAAQKPAAPPGPPPAAQGPAAASPATKSPDTPNLPAPPPGASPAQGGKTSGLGPFNTFEQATQAAAKLPTPKSGNPPHVLGVIVKDASGKTVGQWYEVSEGGMGMGGHTEQKALSRMALKPGMSVELVGHYSPCNLPSGCSTAMSNAAKNLNVDIRYRHVRAEGTTIYDFQAGQGQIRKSDIPRRPNGEIIH